MGTTGSVQITPCNFQSAILFSYQQELNEHVVKKSKFNWLVGKSSWLESFVQRKFEETGSLTQRVKRLNHAKEINDTIRKQSQRNRHLRYF